jgi:hypothetical protein
MSPFEPFNMMLVRCNRRAYQEFCVRGRFHLIPLLDAEPVAEHDGELRHGGGPFALGILRSLLTRRKTKYSSLIAASSVGKSLGCERMIARRVILEGAGHGYVDDLVRHVRIRFGGRGGSGFQLAIALTQSRAFSLSAIPGKCLRSSTTADSSPLSSNTWRMASAVVSSTLNMVHTMAGRFRSDNRRKPRQGT